MSDSLTPNIGLLVADPNDVVSYTSHIGNNWTKSDSLMGAVDCLSTARPTTTYKGQIVFEEDSKRYAQNIGTSASPNWLYMSHQALSVASSAHPTSGLTAGELIYETDTNRFLIYNGSTFVVQTAANFVCTSSAHPAFPFTGLDIYETDTKLSAVYNGSTYLYPSQQPAPTQTLSGTTASVTFSGLSSLYTTVSVLWSARDNSANGSDALKLRLNGDTGTNYLWQYVQGSSSSATAAVSTADSAVQVGVCTGGTATAGYYSGGRFSINGWNKAASGRFATVSGTGYVGASNGAAGQISGAYGGTYQPSAALTSLTLFPASGSFVATSEFSLEVSM